MDNQFLFLGKPIEYWLELDKRTKEINAEELIKEIVELKARLYLIQREISKINQTLK